MPMAPRPSGKTSGPVWPSLRNAGVSWVAGVSWAARAPSVVVMPSTIQLTADRFQVLSSLSCWTRVRRRSGAGIGGFPPRYSDQQRGDLVALRGPGDGHSHPDLKLLGGKRTRLGTELRGV